MTDLQKSGGAQERITIAVDAMGGDLGPAAIVAGISKSVAKNSKIGFLVFGPENELAPLIAKRRLGERCEIRDVREFVKMDDKPAQVMRHGKVTTMWAATSLGLQRVSFIAMLVSGLSPPSAIQSTATPP